MTTGTIAQLGVGLQLTKTVPAVLARHQDIERDQAADLKLARQAKPLVTAARDGDPMSVALEGPADQVSGSRVVVDDEDARALGQGARLGWARTSPRPARPARAPLPASRIVKVEPCPGSLSTRDRPAHHLAETLGDGEAETRAAVVARRRGVGLGELFEEVPDLVGRDPDARNRRRCR